MPILKLNIQNCYGIRNLEHSFDLGRAEGRGGAFSIYAPNGVMKSSLARTLDDFSRGNESSDLIFPSRVPLREVLWDGEPLDSNRIFVIKPYVESFESEGLATLIANPTLQKEYTKSVKELLAKRKKFSDALKSLSGISSRTATAENELKEILQATEETFPSKLHEILQEPVEAEYLKGIKYSDVFNDKTMAVLKKPDFKSQLSDYVGLYNRLVDESPVLSRKFNHQGAAAVTKNLKDSGFYQAGHSVKLKVGDTSQEVATQKELESLFQEERAKILSDDDLKKKFESVDKALGNAQTKKLRSLIEGNPGLMADLSDLHSLRRKLWSCHLSGCQLEAEDFVNSSEETASMLGELVKSAQEEETKWQKVIEIFKRRFDVPFNLTLKNQVGVILKGEKPAKTFSFQDAGEESEVQESVLLSILSQGERRALYILNILFEIETAQEEGSERLIVVDDIADSFDYRNKYAIVEYLRELSRDERFTFLFLTHNFDFHRTISSRLGLGRNRRLFAARSEEGISLSIEKYQKDVFASWKNQLGKNEIQFIASIPFVRNLAEYSGKEDVFNSLTECLHLKSGSADKTLEDVLNDFSQVIEQLPDIKHDSSLKVLERIEAQAVEIVQQEQHHIELEEKVVLSIAIRLKAEKYMLDRLDNPEWEEPTSNQTRELFDDFAGAFSSELNSLRVLDQVNLMTPENIHLNSFMFEPILDMAPQHLFKLHGELQSLLDELTV